MKYFFIIKVLFLIQTIGFSQNQWDIRFTQSNLNCVANQVCYQLEVQNTMGSDWTLADQNYRLFFDGDLMTVVSVNSLLPSAFYGVANIDQNFKTSGQGQEAASPLDDIDDNLGFLDFSIVQSDKSNPSAAVQLMSGTFTPIAEICVDVVAAVINDASGSNCLSLIHSRPSTAGTFTNQYTTITENDAPGSTVASVGVNYNDLTPADGTDACLGLVCETPEEWDIQLTQSNINCAANQVCYQLEVKNTAGDDWTLADQNYRLFFDGDLMTVVSVTSLLPNAFYSSANIDMNNKYSGLGQESASPLDDIDDNLGFLDFNIVQTDKSNPSGAVQLVSGTFTPVAEICVDVAPSVLSDQNGSTCLTFVHSRPSTAGTFTNQYTTITENDAPASTGPSMGVNYNDLTSADGTEACPGPLCATPEEWDIQLTQSNINCAANQVCYQLEVQNTAGNDWTLADQNYRLFFDGDLMTVVSVTSLLPNAYYGNAIIDMNNKYSGQGQEASSPLDDIDDNLGFLDFNIVQTDKSNPSGAVQLVSGTFTPVAEICVDVDPSVLSDQNGSTCLTFVHSRPSTAGTFTNQYTTITENDAPASTGPSIGVNYNDLTSADGTEACPGPLCTPPNQWDIQLTQSNFDCPNEQVCYELEVQNNAASGADWTIGDQNYRLFFDGDLMTVTSVTSLLPNAYYGSAVIDMNTKYSGVGQEMSSPLDDIDDNLGFLDFTITQTDKTNPVNAIILTNGTFTSVAEICVDLDASVIAAAVGDGCIAFYHSRPSTAGTFTNQYTTITENDAANSTTATVGVNYDDLTSADGTMACLGQGLSCNISGPNLVLANQQNVSFSNTTSADNYLWSVVSGDAVIDGANNGQNVMIDFGTMNSTIQIIVSNAAGCSQTCTFDVMIDGSLSCSFTGPTEVCSNSEDWKFTGPIGASSYSWVISSGDAVIDGASNLRILNVDAGTTDFTVELTISPGNPTTCLQTVTVHPDPIVTATGNDVCDGDMINLMGVFNSAGSSTAITTWGWIGPNNFTSLQQNPTPFTANAAAIGTYTVTAVDNNGCSSSDMVTIDVFTNPTCNISGSTTAVENSQNVVYSAPSGMTNYAWSVTNGDATIDGANNGQNVTIDFGTTNSTIELTITDANNCTSTCTINVTMTTSISCGVTGPDFICSNTAGLVYSGPAGASTYNWVITNGDATINGSNTQQNVIVDAGDNDFTIELTVNPGSPAVCTKDVTVYTNPADNLTVSDSIICRFTDAVPIVYSSELGVSYQVRSDADNSLIGDPVVGTGNDISLLIEDLNTAGTFSFTVIATDISGNCTTELIDKAVIMVRPCDFQDFLPECAIPACHFTSNDIYLGNGVSAEATNSGTATADTDNDDGVKLPNDFRPNTQVRLPTTIYNVTGNPAYLAIWIDWNADGDYEDAGEQIANNIYDPTNPAFNGTFIVSIPVDIPADAVQEQDISLRLRLSTDVVVANSPCGQQICAADGEIEDYLIQVSCPPEICLPVGVNIQRN